ncbi:TetR/AcrR family transcriptional regulator [Pseudactinotalea sp. HY158]|uniref:TetR/AcrR family transcriptional regulator n=1 Tax=Pseudactinotalea sp. HY158 TaxID=2654547 RepID=UPI00129C66D6|nr:TetR/AcrR family transcriptional regulator [Pseudactinotalea sp. HY158]QGH69676.1 hypothetical protein GCE65_09255 [Pseudactinotalea sp. HY158]
MSAREEWIMAGLAALRANGIDAVRIDPLAETLGKTKGSFHHHFAGVEKYHRALLERFEADAVGEVHRLIEAVADLDLSQALARIAVSIRYDARIESAVRGWAATNTAAREAMARVDAARLDALTELWGSEFGDPRQARIAALVPHLVIVGASVAQPTPSRGDMAAVFAVLSSLVPHVGAGMPAETRDCDPG